MTDFARLAQHACHIPEALQAHVAQITQRLIEHLSPEQLAVFDRGEVFGGDGAVKPANADEEQGLGVQLAAG